MSEVCRSLKLKNERVTENLVRELLRKQSYYDTANTVKVDEQKTAIEDVTKLLKQASPNTVHLGVQAPHITDRVFWDRQRWRVFLPACQPAFV